MLNMIQPFHKPKDKPVAHVYATEQRAYFAGNRRHTLRFTACPSSLTCVRHETTNRSNRHLWSSCQSMIAN